MSDWRLPICNNKYASLGSSRITPIVTVIYIYIRIYNNHKESLIQLLQRERVHHRINDIVTIVENVRQNGIVYVVKRFKFMLYYWYKIQNPSLKIGKSIIV